MLRTSKAWWAALAVVLCATTVLADNGENRYEESYSKRFTFHGGRVTVEQSFGSVVLDTSSGPDVEVRATVRASDPDFGRQIHIIAAENGHGVTVRTEYPEHFTHHGNFSYSVDYHITVPANAPVSVRNRFGSIEASGVRAASEFINAQGSIRLRDLGGPQRIENSFGSVDVTNLGGPVTISNANGSVRAHDINSNLDVKNRFGSVEIQNARENVAVMNTNGSVTVTEVGGSLAVTNSFASVTITNVHGNLAVAGQNSRVQAQTIRGNANIATTFGSVEVRDVGGPLTVKNENGSIQAEGVNGDFNADTRFASVRAERIRGSADVDNANGSVQLTDVSSNVKVHTSFGSAFVRNVGGRVDIENQNGAIGVSGLARGACRPVTLRTSYSSIKVAMPPSGSYSVNARTSFGRINSSIPMTTTSESNETVVGTINGGACRMELVNSNGSITIERE